ncbi:hypothetical protein T484DRAFT_1760329, partial [Baffinella frigidus]
MAWEFFRGIFTVLDERTFRDVFTLNLQVLFDHLLRKDTCIVVPQHFLFNHSNVMVLFDHLLRKDTCIAVPQHFLSNQSVTKPFTDILLQFLVQRIRDLSSSDKHEGQVILNLFKTIFIGISTYPDNEHVLKQHVRQIVIACLKHAMQEKRATRYYLLSCLKHAMQEKRATSYYLLLKTFFRSVSDRKFEHLQKEFIALLKNLLENLCKMLAAAQEDDTKELLVELCLTVPARLNFLLPHIPLLMKPLVQALNGSPEMVHLGLKKLENWVESLQPAFLDPLLQSSGNNGFALAAIRILGKLGGRNRR